VKSSERSTAPTICMSAVIVHLDLEHFFDARGADPDFAGR
jgi:hypothetical protein